MEAPKCRLCSKKHYGLCDKSANKIHNANITEMVDAAEVNTDSAYQTYLKQKEWKRNYMREYMKKDRAEKKRRAK